MENKQEVVYDKYQRRGAGYHWEQMSRNPLRMSAFVKARYARCVDLYVEQAGSLQGHEVLDFGCGDGAFSWFMAQRGARVCGIDLAAEAVAFANRRHDELGTGARFYVESCYETHFPPASFDGVLSTDVIEHVQDPQRFLAEIDRVLRPGGTAIISTPIRLTEQPLDRLHVVEWFPGDFATLIRSVFPDARFCASHPVFWAECAQRSKLLRTLTNLLSFYSNPFLHRRKWSLFALQYAVCRKPA